MPNVDLVLQGFTLGTDQGSIAYCGVTLIEGPKRILVDVAHVGRRELLINRLRERGLSPLDIDLVVLTHGHWDHIHNIDLFKNAEVLIHPRERAYLQNPHPDDWAVPAYTSGIVERMNLREVQEGIEIADGVSVLDTPGHSAGSISLVVQTSDGPAVICGDALPNARTALAGSPYLIFYNEQAARASAAKILEHARFLYPGHDRPFEIVGPAVRYLMPTSVRVQLLIEPGESDAGVTLASVPPNTVRVVAQALQDLSATS